MKKPFIVAVYDMRLKYGGPENGGWWFREGSLMKVVRTFTDEEFAHNFCGRLNKKLEGPYVPRRPMYGILCHGKFQAQVRYGTPPDKLPEVPPTFPK